MKLSTDITKKECHEPFTMSPKNEEEDKSAKINKVNDDKTERLN
jgi:hypothetical protein